VPVPDLPRLRRELTHGTADAGLRSGQIHPFGPT
jgi:hypothetical protein